MSRPGRSIALEGQHVTASRESLDGLRLEAAELRASRKRLALAAVADRRLIERELHSGVQQHLVTVAVNLQRLAGLVDADPAAAKTLLEEMARDTQQALDEAARLAERIHSPLLYASGLAAALRSAAMRTGVSVSVHVEVGASYSPEFAGTVYLCCLEALECADAGDGAMLEVRGDAEAVAFEFVGHARSAAGFDRLSDRVEALGGRLTIRPEPGRGTRVSGLLPLSG